MSGRTRFAHAFAVLFAGSATLSAVTFTFDDFSNPSGIQLVGNASLQSNVLRLTPALENQKGAAWINTPVNVQDGFVTTFQFRITDRGGWSPDWEPGVFNTGADGFAFVIQNTAVNAIGLFASGVGYYGLPNSLAVEFDTWNNIPEYCEPSGNHIAVNTLGTADNRPEHCPGNGFSNPNLAKTNVVPDMSNGSVYDVKITYTPGLLQIYLGDLLTPLLSANVNLAQTLSLLNGTEAFVGFTSSTGGAWENHDIVKWSMTAIPEPSTWLLAGAALAALGAWRRGRR